MTVPPVITARLEQYCQRHAIARGTILGQGKDGSVWETNRRSALKIHASVESYLPELNAYIRLRERNIKWIAGFAVPILLNHDDELFALEMTVVSPPYVLDFASARLDAPLDLIEDEGHTLADLVHDRFGERAAEIFYLRHELETKAGIYITDLHPHNIKFAP